MSPLPHPGQALFLLRLLPLLPLKHIGGAINSSYSSIRFEQPFKMKVSGSYAAITALAATANARHLLVRSEPTVAVSLADNGVSPRPTEAPEYDLLRRADQGTLLYAPDNTCGFISGLEGAGYTCFGTYTCAFSKSKDEGHVACCADGVCNMRFNCIDSVGYSSSSQCTGGCDVDALTLKW